MSSLFKMSAEDLLSEYGIELRADKSVYDPVEDRTFRSLVAWKDFIDQQEDDSNYGGFDKAGGRYGWDDE